MTLADICKEEVDPLVSHIKNLMNSQVARQLTNDDDLFRLDSPVDKPHETDKFASDAHSFDEVFKLEPTERIHDLKSPQHQTGQPTVDMFMSNLLKPMLKEWIDHNLSTLVSQIVTERIDRLMYEFQQTTRLHSGAD